MSIESTILLAFSRIGRARAKSASTSSLMIFVSATFFSTISFSTFTTASFSSATALSFLTYSSVTASSSFDFAKTGSICVICILRAAIDSLVFLRVVRPLARRFRF